MQITVLKDNLKKALSFVGKNVSGKAQLPVLSHVLLETSEGKLKISSTNLETSIVFWIGAVVEKEGKLTAPARILTELVNSFVQEKIIISSQQTSLKLVCGESEATLNGMAAEEFPPLPAESGKKDFTLSLATLKSSLPLVLISASSDFEGRPILTGLKIFTKDKQVVLVATDGFRLSVKQIPQVSGLEEALILTSRALSETFRLLVEEKEEQVDVHLSKDKNQVLFSLPQAQIATRLIEGEFPAYEKIIPRGFKTKAVFETQELLSAVKFASVYAKESANIVRIKIENNTAIITASSQQVGGNKTTISVDQQGDEGEMAFNARFLLDLLSVFPEEKLVFEMTDPLAPGVFKPAKDDSFLHIIMPVRIQE